MCRRSHAHLVSFYPPGVIERWELLQAQDLSKEIRTKQNQQQWQQLNSDLNNIWTWLGQTGEELEQQRRLQLCTDIQTIEQRIKKLKVAGRENVFRCLVVIQELFVVEFSGCVNM